MNSKGIAIFGIAAVCSTLLSYMLISDSPSHARRDPVKAQSEPVVALIRNDERGVVRNLNSADLPRDRTMLSGVVDKPEYVTDRRVGDAIARMNSYGMYEVAIERKPGDSLRVVSQSPIFLGPMPCPSCGCDIEQDGYLRKGSVGYIEVGSRYSRIIRRINGKTMVVSQICRGNSTAPEETAVYPVDEPDNTVRDGEQENGAILESATRTKLFSVCQACLKVVEHIEDVQKRVFGDDPELLKEAFNTSEYTFRLVLNSVCGAGHDVIADIDKQEGRLLDVKEITSNDAIQRSIAEACGKTVL